MDSYLEDLTNNVHIEEAMKNEWARFNSFKDFPLTALPSPLKLSQSGFYYTGDGENVTCFSCKKECGNWKEDEGIRQAHFKVSPNCPFINGHVTDNCSIAENNRVYDEAAPEVEENKDRIPARFDVNNGPAYVPSPEPSEPEPVISRICLSDGKHPNYMDTDVRLESFHNIPWMYGEIVDTNLLADAGFYYVGTGDCVRCFFCGGGLRHWDYGDLPAVEHARWFPKCEYIIYLKGKEFVEQHKEPSDEEVEENTGAATQTLNVYGTRAAVNNTVNVNTTPGKISGELNEDELHDLMNSEESNLVIAWLVYEMGYDIVRVRETIRLYFQTHTKKITTKYILNMIETAEAAENRRTAPPVIQEFRGTNNSFLYRTPAPNNKTPTPHPVDALNIKRRDPNNPVVPPTELENKPTPKPKTTGSKRAMSLVEENEQLKEMKTCKVCLDNDSNTVFLPCGHMATCEECAVKVAKCVICRTVIKGTVKAFQS